MEKETLKERVGNAFEKLADHSTNLCVHLVWGDEAEMPKCLQQKCESMND